MLYTVWIITLLLIVFSFIKDRKKTMDVFKSSFLAFKKMYRGILITVLILGFVLSIIPKESLINLFAHKGLTGFFLVSLTGAIVTIPGPIAFPLAGSLFELGASKAVLASFITTLTMVGLTTAPLEMGFFGRRFVLLRQGLSFLAAILIGAIMGAVI